MERLFQAQDSYPYPVAFNTFTATVLIGCTVGRYLRVTAPSDNVGGFPVDLCAGMADLVAGYMDCMEEALRYLIEEEKYPEHHPAVQGLRQHLAQLLDQALMQQSMTVTPAA
ncbi:hypothetical protein M8J75_009046 [Diaphorina citri]|nr:hypothetical protein M8J75_009046 [Diaphorina citri]